MNAPTTTIIGYPAHPDTGPIMFSSPILVATAMGPALVLGSAATGDRDVAAHRAWMVRADALAVGAGTQAFTGGFTEAAVGPGVVPGDLAKPAGRILDLTVAEWAICRTARTRPRPHAVGGQHGGSR